MLDPPYGDPAFQRVVQDYTELVLHSTLDRSTNLYIAHPRSILAKGLRTLHHWKIVYVTKDDNFGLTAHLVEKL